jgi:hypothetical protein
MIEKVAATLGAIARYFCPVSLKLGLDGGLLGVLVIILYSNKAL